MPNGRPTGWYPRGARPLPGIFVVAAIACSSGGTATHGPSSVGGERLLQAAEDVYFSLDLENARSAFQRIYEDESVGAEYRATAALRLAAIASRFDDLPHRAQEWLDAAEASEAGRFDVRAERVRVLERSRELETAEGAARDALAAAATRSERIAATAAVGRVALKRAVAASLDDARAQESVAEAHRLLGDLLEHEWGWLEPSRVALGLALLAEDGSGALEAWRSYRWTDDGRGSGTAQTPRSVLSGWAGANSARDTVRRVVSELAATAFNAEAAIAAIAWTASRASEGPNPTLDEAIAYGHFMAQVRAAAEDYYRRRALGQASYAELDSTFDDLARAMWEELPWPGQRRRFSETALRDELARRFGAEIHWTRNAFARSLYYGHRVTDVAQTVSQYGRSAEVRFLVLDEMVSSGYTTWFWDGRAATGGWVNDAREIVQVRPAYAEGPLEAWLETTDPEERASREREIAARTAIDADIAASEPHAYLPGLTLRLEQQAHDAILQELEARGLTGDRLRAAFLEAVEMRTRASSIFAHEGRHALDRADGMMGWLRRDADREYRAKLSEVAFAPSPRLALIGGILSPNIGDETSHGQANLRVVKNLVTWMSDHASEIDGLDRSQPLLPQLDLLTDEQMRAAFRSMDPWS